jgi:hypothetical protein
VAVAESVAAVVTVAVAAMAVVAVVMISDEGPLNKRRMCFWMYTAAVGMGKGC